MSENEIIWTSFQLPHHCFSQICMHFFFPSKEFSCLCRTTAIFDILHKNISLVFTTGLAVLEHKLTRPVFPSDINPTVVVSSRLSGMWKPLLSFKSSTGHHQFSSYVYKRRREHRSSTYISVYMTLSAFPNVAHAQPIHFPYPCRLPLMKNHAPPLHCFFRAVQQCLLATGHLGIGIPWRDDTGCCHVIGEKRQSHHMPKLLASLHLCYGTPCKQQTPSNPVINYHVLTLI